MESLILNQNYLSHVAFILDGNKRWAKKNNFNKIQGYKKGFENIKKIVDFSIEKKISNLTMFTLSSENLERTSVKILYEIIDKNFENFFDELISSKKIRINIFGSRYNIPHKIVKIFEKVESLSCNNTVLNLNIAFNYGFKNEIIEVLKEFKKNINSISLDNSNEIKKLFFLKSKNDPEILIRTGGYKRLSNFIMYNLTYTELFFTDTLWPDFSTSEFENIIEKYLKINRNYGL
ncbi:MAG: di-trans,poly-cis-decaprenylcistransferase [Actinomycetales bacterium]|nr:MAG: di-trans,poly-cis-decaprenylcistransferase [Actinomycetales bacterium]